MKFRFLIAFSSGLFVSANMQAQKNLTLLVKTDMNCIWRLDGQPMGLLTVENPAVVLVSQGDHVVEASPESPKVETATVRAKVKIEDGEKTVVLELKRANDEQLKRQQEDAARVRGGGELAPVWTDPSTGLEWTRKDNGANVGWPEAFEYCSKLRLGNHDDWRLPSLDELQGIYDPDVTSRQKFGDGLTHDVHIKGDLRLTGRVWSNLQGDAPGKPYQWAWHYGFGREQSSNFDLPVARKNFLHFDWDQRALCVRDPVH